MPQDKRKPSSPEPTPRSEDDKRTAERAKDDPSFAPESGEKPEVMDGGDGRRKPGSPQR